MVREIPEVVRAAAGLAATVLDEALKLPRTLPGLPVRVIGLAMQTAMKIQQQYSGLVARGDEVFTGLRGEAEPGLATFDDDDDEVPATTPGFRDSPFDRVDGTITDEEVADLPEDPDADAVVAAVEELAEEIESLEETLDAVEDDAEATDEILGELAIEELVDATSAPDAGTTEDDGALESALLELDRDGATPEGDGAAPEGEAASPEGSGTLVDVPDADGGITQVEAVVTDEGVATVEPPEDGRATVEPSEDGRATVEPSEDGQATGSPAPAGHEIVTEGEIAVDDALGSGADADEESPRESPVTATDEGGTPVAAATGVRTDVGGTDTSETDAAIAEGAAVDAVGDSSAAPTDDPQAASELSGSQAAGTAPIDGYDGFSIAQLRGRLRGYAPKTVQELLEYEEATRARAPYVKMLRNRLERLQAESA